MVPTATGERKITITPDKATNSLVVTAIPEDYQTLVEVIKKLDIPRRQVYVEAAVVEAIAAIEGVLSVRAIPVAKPG